MTWEDLVDLAAALQGVEVSTSYGTPALKVAGKLLTRRRLEDQSLVLQDVSPDEREILITSDPATFHTIAHYENYSIVLARLEALNEARAWVFIERRWRAIAPRRLTALV